MHIHHGYYITGKESKEVAQDNLLKFIADKLQVKSKSNVLDVRCGIGGTDIWLAKNYGCNVTGFTVAPDQVQMAVENAKKAGVSDKTSFLVDDADDIKITEKFDYATAIEVLPHLHDPENFYKKMSKLIKSKGRFAICDWFKDTNLSKQQYDKYIKPIDFGMMVSLSTPLDYMTYLEKNDFRIVSYIDLNQHVYRTWDIGADLIRKPALWKIASKHRAHFINFLKAFAAMRSGYKSKTFRYGLIIAEKK